MIRQNLIIEDLNYKYDIKIKSKYTFITGDSGSGKSHLCDLVAMYQTDNQAVNVNYSKIVDATSFINLSTFIEISEDTIVFIDENSNLFKVKGIFEFIKNAKYRFVIVSRELSSIVSKLDFSVYDIYKLVKDEHGVYYLENYFDMSIYNSKEHTSYIYTEEIDSYYEMWSKKE